MIDPRRTDVRAAQIHLEAVESALHRATHSPVGPFDADVGDELMTATLLAVELRDSLDRAGRLLDPAARTPLARRADELVDEPRRSIGS